MAAPIEIISYHDLLAYPGMPTYTTDQYAAVTDRVNALVTEAWRTPVDPVPQWVKEVALEAAARFLFNPKALESWTRSIDDGSRTERVRAQALRVGVYLDADQERRLRNSGLPKRRTRSISLRVPGY